MTRQRAVHGGGYINASIHCPTGTGNRRIDHWGSRAVGTHPPRLARLNRNLLTGTESQWLFALYDWAPQGYPMRAPASVPSAGHPGGSRSPSSRRKTGTTSGFLCSRQAQERSNSRRKPPRQHSGRHSRGSSGPRCQHRERPDPLTCWLRSPRPATSPSDAIARKNRSVTDQCCASCY